MPTSEGDGLVFSDAQGNYYVLPRELIELSKVGPEARDAVVKELDERHKEPIRLGGGFSFLGIIRLPDEAQWKHFSSDVAWPSGAPRGVVPKTIVFGPDYEG